MKTIVTWCVHKVKEWFSLDYRSLALLRIGIGLVLIFDIIQRLADLRAFYSDAGVLPRSELLRLWENKWWISAHLMSGLTAFEALLFAVAAVFAIMLLLGYRTRFAMIASWMLLVSLHVRNPLVLQGGDVVLRVVMFWMMFLPLNKAWSLDRLFNRTAQPKETSFVGIASVAYILQICILYFFTGILKSGDAWHNGTAVYYALNVDQLITPVGALLKDFPRTMSALTYATWYIEVYGSLLFFSPVATSFFRMLGIILFACLQIGFNASMRLGLFGMIAIVITLGLLPSTFWDSGWRTFTTWIRLKGKRGLTMYYDFDCSFCYKTSHMLDRTLLLHPTTKIIPAKENPEIETLMVRENSWVIVDAQGNRATHWSGACMIAAHSPLVFWTVPLLRLPFISHIGEWLYEYGSHKRKAVCIPEPVATKTQVQKTGIVLANILVLTLVIYVIGWNIDTLHLKKSVISKEVEPIGWFTHLDQQFNMFAPTPLLEDGWYVFPGVLRDGSMVDVFTQKEGPVSYEKPTWVAYTYKNQRWQKYMMNLWNTDFQQYRLGYGRYLCREWNTHHPEEKQLLRFEMIFMLEQTPAPGQTPLPITPTTIWNHQCF